MQSVMIFAKAIHAKFIMGPKGVELHFSNWENELSRMAQVERAVLRAIGSHAFEVNNSIRMILPVSSLKVFTQSKVRAMMRTLSNFQIPYEVSDCVNSWLAQN